MKIAKSNTDPTVSRHVHAFFYRRLNSAVGFAILACLLATSNFSRAGQPVFITTPPAISPFATSTQAQGSLRASENPNQAAMSQIINQLNQSQLQLSAAAAQTSAQRPRFVPQITTIRRAK